MNLSIFFSFLNTIASRAYDAIANRSRPFAALTPAQRATAIAKLTPAQRGTAIANLTARAESNLDQAEQGWRNPCWLTNADTYLTLATEYGYIEGATRRRLDRLRRDFASLESVND
ncbi:hypothetical protein ACFWNH_29080 [Rhodococcus qingshengii]|uniref:hypothetical protein n=1 Tax=Rhodococcus qingshengii TaxID=334542 RepID=UPI00365C47DF